jgi:hypothetical protein
MPCISSTVYKFSCPMESTCTSLYVCFLSLPLPPSLPPPSPPPPPSLPPLPPSPPLSLPLSLSLSPQPCPTTDDGIFTLADLLFSTKVYLFLCPLQSTEPFQSLQVNTVPLSFSLQHEGTHTHKLMHTHTYICTHTVMNCSVCQLVHITTYSFSLISSWC